jgi:hypothetical protein
MILLENFAPSSMLLPLRITSIAVVVSAPTEELCDSRLMAID